MTPCMAKTSSFSLLCVSFVNFVNLCVRASFPFGFEGGMWDLILSYDVAVIQWITSCHKSGMTTRGIMPWRVDVTSLTTSVSTMRFLAEIKFILVAIKSHL